MKLCTPVIAILAMISQLATSPAMEYYQPLDGCLLSKTNLRAEVQSTLGFDVEVYADRIAKHESGYDETSVSPSGLYVGLYQIGDLALKDVGMYPEITVGKFKRDHTIFPVSKQREAVIKIAERNEYYLYKWIRKYDGQVVGGKRITKAGILAAAHHVGATAVKRFLDSGGAMIAEDGNGVKMTRFIIEMKDGCV